MNRHRLLIGLGLAGTALVGSVAGSVLAVQAWAAHQVAVEREAVLAAARQQAINLTTMDYRRVTQDVARIVDGATGALRQQFAGGGAQLAPILAEARSVSAGRVLETGLVSLDSERGTAEVLAVTDARVSNTQVSKAGQPATVRHFRMSVRLSRQDGRWLVSDVAFAGGNP